jgi:hypothetical protein
MKFIVNAQATIRIEGVVLAEPSMILSPLKKETSGRSILRLNLEM